MVEVVRDNTDVNKLRRRMVDMTSAFEESMLREISRFKEEVQDLDVEIQEGMSNRVGSGFQANEAKKYAYRLVKPIMRDTLQDLEGIMTDVKADVATMVGEEFTEDQDKPLGGMIGKAGIKNYEMSELEIKVLEPPAPTEG
jgi:hypothetical protein